MILRCLNHGDIDTESGLYIAELNDKGETEYLCIECGEIMHEPAVYGETINDEESGDD